MESGDSIQLEMHYCHSNYALFGGKAGRETLLGPAIALR